MSDQRWLSHVLTNTVARIILTEMLGYSVAFPEMPLDANFLEDFSQGRYHMDLENWWVQPGTRAYETYVDNGWLDDAGKIGYEGRAGLYVSQSLVQQHWAADFYKFYRNASELASMGFMKFNASRFRQVAGANFPVCDASIRSWCGTGQLEGAWAPPACQDDPTECIELISISPVLDTAYFEQLARVHELPVVFSYVGLSALSYMWQLTQMGRPGIVYGFEPEPYVGMLGVVRISFPDHSLGCEVDFQTHRHPDIGNLECDYGSRGLRKIVGWKSIYEDAPEAYYFVSRLQILKDDIDLMMSAVMAKLSGSYTGAVREEDDWAVFEAACDFVKSNMERVESWAPPCLTNPANATSESNGEVFNKDTRQCENGTFVESKATTMRCGPPPGSVDRKDIDVRLVRRGWLSHDMMSMIAELLLNDFLGYSVRLVNRTDSEEGWLEELYDGVYHIDMEQWNMPVDPLEATAQLGEMADYVVVLGEVGYAVRPGVYVPKWALEQTDFADYYKFFKDASRASASGFVQHSESAQNRSVISSPCPWCGPGDQQGFWPATRCTAHPDRCLELIHPGTQHATGYVEQLVENLGLEVVVTYYDGEVEAAVLDYSSLGKASMFFWWEPSPLLMRIDAARVSFPDHVFGCDAANAHNPSGSVSCDFREIIPTKVMSQDMVWYGPLFYTLKRIQMRMDHLNEHLKTHTSVGGNSSTEEIVCAFVESHPELIAEWLPTCTMYKQTYPIQVNDTVFSWSSAAWTGGCHRATCPPNSIIETLPTALISGEPYTCRPCRQATVPSATQEECEFCPPGFAVAQNGSTCTACEPGRAGRLSICEPCAPGRFASNWGQDTCDECLPGESQAKPGSDRCDPCQHGTFQQEPGQPRCSECRPGTFQAMTGSSTDCHLCSVGRFSSSRAATSCNICSMGTTAHPESMEALIGADSVAFCLCATGSFLCTDPHGHAHCCNCNEYMASCPGGNHTPSQRKGYYITADGAEVFRCASDDACPEGMILGQCPVGSSGPGCADCKEGTHYWSGNRCVECTTGSNFLLFCFPPFVVVVFLLIHHFGNDPIGRSLNSATEFVVVMGLSLNVFIYLSAFNAVDVAWEEPIDSIVDGLTVLANAELLSLSFTCSVTLTAAGQFAMTSLVPMLVLLVCALICTFKIAAPRKLFNTAGNVTYAMFLLLVLHALKPFRFIIHPSGRKSVLSMPNVVDGSEDHRQLVVVGIMVLLVYCVTFLALCIWASLAVHRTPKARSTLWYLETFKFLFFKFRPQAYYWGIVVLLRNTVFAVAPSLWPSRPVIAVFILGLTSVVSAVHTALIWPWKLAWMNAIDISILCYMSLLLTLAAGWVREDRDSSGILATGLSVVALLALIGLVSYSLACLFRVLACKERRKRLRSAILAVEQAELAEQHAFFGPWTQVSEVFEALTQEVSGQSSNRLNEETWTSWISKQECNVWLVEAILQRMRHKNYSALDYVEDCMSAFPELHLHAFLDGKATLDLESTGENCLSPNASNPEEQLRTLGALLAIYWICRLDMDGKQGLAFGVDEDRGYAPRSSSIQKEEVDALSWGKMTPQQRQAHFYWNFNWDLFRDLFCDAGIILHRTGKIELDTRIEGQLAAMLSLTAYHDIMKDPKMCPVVRGEPYGGFEPGETIMDHDLALAYILDRQPDILPSFAVLSRPQQMTVRFTQSEMGFNAGWLVQAEGPPSAVLSKLKRVVEGGAVSDKDLAFYFVHWVTDLAGAEPTPGRGTEKFACKFPPHVLQSLLGCFCIVKALADQTETQVYESYLVRRWEQAHDILGPLPSGMDRTARLRLHCMGQQNAKSLLDAFERIPEADQSLLAREMAETGLLGQQFSEWQALQGPGVGTPFLLYYGPAWCQRVGQTHPELCLQVLAEAYRAARNQFPESFQKQKEEELEGTSSRTIMLSVLKAAEIEDLQRHLREDRHRLCSVTAVNRLEGELEVWNVLDI